MNIKKEQIFDYLKSRKIFEKFSDNTQEEDMPLFLKNKFKAITEENNLDDHGKRRMGRYYYINADHEAKQKNLKKALSIALNSVKFYETIQEMTADDYRELSYVYNMLGNISYILALENSAKETMHYYQKAIELRQKISDKSLIDYHDISSYRRNLSSYFDTRELEENYFSRDLELFTEEKINETRKAKL